jgi:hypothetical protein
VYVFVQFARKFNELNKYTTCVSLSTLRKPANDARNVPSNVVIALLSEKELFLEGVRIR